MAREGRLRWAVEISRWQPSDREFDFLCSILPPEDATECRKFKFLDDRKRAVLSRLLQRHAAASVLAIPHDSVEIKRTRGRKPYAANPVIEKRGAPNFNYSVSHEVSKLSPTPIWSTIIKPALMPCAAHQETLLETFAQTISC